MNRVYWEGLADRFDEEVLSIADLEVNGALRTAIRRVSRDARTVGDFGCGNGALLPALSRRFASVYAVDFAQALLNIARSRHHDLPGIDFVRYNLSGRKAFPHRVDVAVCVNVLIDPRAPVRDRILRNVIAAVRPGGCALVIVPAFESLLHTYRTLVRCNVRLGVRRSTALRETTDLYQSEVTSVVDGIVTLGNAPTKTYMHDEARHLLEDAGLEVDRVVRVEYPWSEMIDNAPADLASPYPWDWLLTARRPERI